MGKFTKMGNLYAEEKAFEKEQEKLHNKHESIGKEKVIVEKSGVPKAAASLLKSVGKAVFGVILILLAAIGIITLIYPQLRLPFIEVLNHTFTEIISMN